MFGIRSTVLAAMAVCASVMAMSQALAVTQVTARTAGAFKPRDAKAAAAAASDAAVSEPQVPKLSVAQILERHVAARGGLPAWKKVQTLQLSGRLEAGRGDNVARASRLANASKRSGRQATNADVVAANVDPDSLKQIQLPFTLDLKRPNLTRLEVEFDGKTALQVWDGKQGWKYRPFLNRNDVEPFSAEETRTEAARGDLDGLLIDHAAKGTKVELEGSDLVDEQPAYRLRLTLKGGSIRHAWIDAKTFLDVKLEGFPRRMDGKMHPVYVYQRDFRSVQGVMLPFSMETAIEGYTDTHKLLIEKAAINPAIDGASFSKPRA